MAKEKKSMIGFDPLAWLSEDEPDKDTRVVKKAGNSKAINVFGKSIDENSITRSYALIQESLDEIVADFYKELFSEHPALIPLFENSDDASRATKLSAALNLLFENINDEQTLINVLTDLGSRHQAYGAEQAHYAVVASTLIETCHKHAGRKWTKKMTAAWELLLTGVAETMLAAYNDAVVEEVSTENAMAEHSEVIESDDTTPAAASDSNTLILENVQDISKSNDLKEKMMALVKENKSISIDAVELTRIDGSALQLLAAFFQYADTHDIQLSWVEPSDSLMESAEYLGLKKILDLDYFGLF